MFGLLFEWPLKTGLAVLLNYIASMRVPYFHIVVYLKRLVHVSTFADK